MIKYVVLNMKYEFTGAYYCFIQFLNLFSLFIKTYNKPHIHSILLTKNFKTIIEIK